MHAALAQETIALSFVHNITAKHLQVHMNNKLPYGMFTMQCVPLSHRIGHILCYSMSHRPVVGKVVIRSTPQEHKHKE
jgi:hypothetical protein